MIEYLNCQMDIEPLCVPPLTTMSSEKSSKAFSTLGMFILDKFEYLDEQGRPTGRETTEQVRTARHPCIRDRNRAYDRLDRWRWNLCSCRMQDVVRTFNLASRSEVLRSRFKVRPGSDMYDRRSGI